ncbi:MAG: hypothetical protein IKE65_08400 [Clostridia bacterium]|nr:hypothetical protein [Clostridia bacterium]
MLHSIKQKFHKFAEYPYAPVVVFAVCITLFYLLFTRLLPKTDDGNFLAAAFEEGFSYKAFLTQRYEELSGRTIIEFLTMFFVRRNIFWWKLMCAAIYTYLAAFLCRLSKLFSRSEDTRGSFVFCCCALFFMIVSCINSSAFWFSASFTYLVPLFGVVCALAPAVFHCLGEEVRLSTWLCSVPAAVLAVSQEQALAVFLFIEAVCIVYCVAKKKCKVFLFIDFIIGAFFSYYLLHAPGVRSRIAFEGEEFPAFSEMNVLQKLFCGTTVGIAHTVYLSVFLFAFVVALLCLHLYYRSEQRSKWIKYSFFVFLGVILFCHLAAIILEKGLAHQIVRSAYLNQEFSASFIILAAGGIAAVIYAAALVVMYLKTNVRLGMCVLVLLCAAAGCALAMGFSSSIFASGQRVFFIGNMLISFAAALLFAALPTGKMRGGLLKLAKAYAGVFALVECIAFILIEHPLMG